MGRQPQRLSISLNIYIKLMELTEYEKAVKYGLELISKQKPDTIKKNQQDLIKRVNARYFPRERTVA